MGVDTKAKLRGHVPVDQVLQFIRDTFDNGARITYSNHDDFDEISDIKERYDSSGRWLTDCHFITFNVPEDGERRIFYCYSNVNFYENLEYYQGIGLEDMVKSETTYLSFRCWGKSVDIMKAIVSHFGGWIDENDCDEFEFYEIDKE